MVVRFQRDPGSIHPYSTAQPQESRLSFLPEDEIYMARAIALAESAAKGGEVPVGAVVVYDGRIIGAAHNLTRRVQDTSAHAEFLALRQAADWLGHWYFDDCTLYSTLEPCIMCAGVLVLGKLGRLVYGAAEPKFGGCGSIFNLVEEPALNHRLSVTRGVLAAECGSLLKSFFKGIREESA